MKHLNISIVLLGVTLLASTTGCSDFLNKEPLSQGTDAVFYKTPDQFKQAANAFYDDIIAWKDFSGSASYSWMDQGLDISGLGTNGGGTAGQTDVNWDTPYSNIRQYNVLISKAKEYTGSQSDIKQYVAAARFFRACI